VIESIFDFFFHSTFTFRPIDMTFWVVLLVAVGAFLVCWKKRD
jgi:amino acid permease